jgi:molybdenum cofactor cytidylyltransferase
MKVINMEPNIIGIYLAAGKSSRMGRPKLSIKLWRDERLGGVALKQAAASNLNRIVIVTKKEDCLDWLPAQCIRDDMERCQSVVCQEADQGMAYSLRCGLAAAREWGSTAVIVLLADQPFVTSEMINRLIAEYRRNSQLHFVASGDGNRKKPPILWDQSMFELLNSLEGDEGARMFLESPDYQGVVVPEPLQYRFMDADTFDNIKEIIQWEQQTSGQ